MKPSEKLKSDVLRSMSELRGKGPSAGFAQAFTARYFTGLPAEAQAALSLSFKERCAADPEKAGDWAAAIGSIFLEDYDGTELAAEDWKELRDILSESSGELDLGLLSYAMGLVLEHKAL
jgi:hypothetical protein